MIFLYLAHFVLAIGCGIAVVALACVIVAVLFAVAVPFYAVAHAGARRRPVG